MVAPGNLPLSIIRGIEASPIILQAKDDNVTVTGTVSPSVNGVYVLSGAFSGYPLFILDFSPSTFLYFNTTAASYVIARILTTGALTDYWSPAAPLTEPTGTYVPHGANTGTAIATDHPVDLTGYDVEAVVRRTPSAEMLIDLQPTITDPTNGEITIPLINVTDTDDLPFTGVFQWDLVLITGTERFGPYLKGTFTISDNITQLSPP